MTSKMAQKKMKSKKLPFGVKLLSYVLMTLSLIAVFKIFYSELNTSWVLIIASIVIFVLGFSLLKGKNWARIGVAVIAILDFVFAVSFSADRYRFYIEGIIYLIIGLYLLLGKDVREAFR